MKFTSLIKYVIIGFIIVAVYNGNQGSIKNLANKTTRYIRSFENTPKKEGIAPEQTKEDITPEQTKEDIAPEQKQAPAGSIPFKVEAKDNDSVISNMTVNIINKVLDNPNGRVIFEGLVNKMVTNYHGALGEDIIHKEFIAKDMIAGTGKTALCGDEVTITYSISQSSEKTSAANLQTMTKTLFIGKQDLNKSLENGLIGMKEKGQRKILYNEEEILKKNAAERKKDFLLADVTLDKINQKLTEENDWGIFVDKNSFAVIGPKIMCGDTVESYYKIRDIKGKVMYDSKEKNHKVIFEIGSKKTPQKISNGLMGLVKDKSKISVILDKKSLQYTDPKGRKLLPKENQKDELFIIDIDTSS